MYLPVELPRDRTRVSLQLQWGFSMGDCSCRQWHSPAPGVPSRSALTNPTDPRSERTATEASTVAGSSPRRRPTAVGTSGRVCDLPFAVRLGGWAQVSWCNKRVLLFTVSSSFCSANELTGFGLHWPWGSSGVLGGPNSAADLSETL